MERAHVGAVRTHMARRAALCASALSFFLQRTADTDLAIPYPRGKAAASLYLSSVEAFRKYEMEMSAAQKAEFRARIMDNACQIALTIPAYVLKVTLAGQFWDVMDQALSSRGAESPDTGLKKQSSAT